MNWIILFLAGLFEVSLTFCLGKRERHQVLVLSVGKRVPCFHHTEHGFACQGGADVAFGYGIRHLDRHRGGRHGLDRNIRFQGTCHSHPAFLPVHTHCFLDWIESRIILRGGGK